MMLGVHPAIPASGGLRKSNSATSVPSLSRGGQLLVTDLESAFAVPASDSYSTAASTPLSPSSAPLLLNSASAARWRRKDSQHKVPLAREIKRSASDVELKADRMEELHGVDVSWLHRPNKEHHHRKHTHSASDVKKDARPAVSHQSHSSTSDKQPRSPPALTETKSLPSLPDVTPPTPIEQPRDAPNHVPTAPGAATYGSSPGKQQLEQPKRPGMFSRTSSERVTQDNSKASQENKPTGKRSSWMNSLSSKFSSTPERPGPTPTQAPKQVQPQLSPLPTPTEEAEASTPSKDRKDQSGSFFSSITRRLSAASQTGGIPKVQGTSVCPRRVLNVDPNRQRVMLPEMDSSKLRKVAFNVDVEVMGGSRYREEDGDDDDDEEKSRKRKEFKMREKAEGAALKNPDALADEKDNEGEPELESKANSLHTRAKDSISTSKAKAENADQNGAPADLTEEDRDAAARKKEKKQRSEAERKERKEKRRLRAQENGQIPVELILDGDGDDATAGATPANTSTPNKNGTQTTNSSQPQPNAATRQTTDPARIYRRCCQLRESPILKRITEQLMNPKCMHPQEPGVVVCLDLTGSRLQLADVITLGDWLAIVPVKHLKMEDADLNDEGVRCVLAGLLAAKKPTPAKKKSKTPLHRTGIPRTRYQERAGVVEKITFKNNPRISKTGWKHISLFIYMCRSLRTIDLSMNQFPERLPPSGVNAIKHPDNAPPGRGSDIDAAETLYHCLSQRLAGKTLEELILSECNLNTPQLRKVVDGAIMAGITRLGLAGNHIDDDGLQSVLSYLRSGMCQALDIGGNDLRGKLDRIADALYANAQLPCWGLCLADCNLDTASLKPLFAQLVKLPTFRFIDLSHNRDLCSHDNEFIFLIRRYLSRLPDMKRIHLNDVGMNPKQAIGLADVLPDGPRLAHLSLLENPELTALANAKTESDQEEACALYASLMAAVRVSNTLVFIDIDVPSNENSEVVKALAKQVVAYSLRNMENFAIADATGNEIAANAAAALTQPHGGEEGVKKFTVPDVLMSLVGHVDGFPENHDQDDPAPDEDYIVGGTGVVKALQYVLGATDNESKRLSLPPTPTGSGSLTPKDRPVSSAGGLMEIGKAKKMSKNLLGSARKIRDRLQPALIKEELQGNEAAYRKLYFLDQTLQGIIQRFEEEYPETRLTPASPPKAASDVSSFVDQTSLRGSSINTAGTEPTTTGSDEEDALDADDDGAIRPTPTRKGSDVSIASRHLSLEEGRLHRLGQQLRRDIIDSPRTATDFRNVPWQQAADPNEDPDAAYRRFGETVQNLSGIELRDLVDAEGWDSVLKKVGGNYEDLRRLQEEDPEAWESFKEAQEKAKLNT